MMIIRGFVPLLFLRGVLGSLLTDYDALVSLKASLNDPEECLTNWQGNARNVCSWSGVTCDESRTAVTRLNLSSLAISGTLSPKVGNLCSLTHLWLSNNKLTGPIPPLPCCSNSLQVLSLDGNNFTGGIPPELGSCIHLVELNLETNALGGPLPKELCKLRNLRLVSFGMLGLHGRIPDCLGELESLQELIARGNSLEGSIPVTLSKLKNLELLDFSMNTLTGGIPPELGSLPNLRILRLWTNQLRGRLPVQLGSLFRLTHFDLSTNFLEGTVPDIYASLKSLQSFRIHNNSLSGNFPSWLAELNHIFDISLTLNHFEGNIPQSLGMSSPLQTMDLGGNNFTGPIPTGLCNGNALSYLVLLDNQFSGPLPSSIQQCKALKKLMVDHNKLSGSINLSLPLLNSATLSVNSFNGTLELSSEMKQLTRFEVSFNQLRGEAPASLEQLTSLRLLLLQNNSLSGRIPAGLGNLPLEQLHLDNNHFDGDIPSSLFTCSKLIVFTASHNNLKGSIPSSLTSLQSVSSIDFSRNFITGRLPNSVPRTLLTLDLSYNNLSGEIPPSLKNLNLNITGNGHICGENSGLISCNPSDGPRPRKMSYLERRNMVLIIILSTFLFLVIVFFLIRKLFSIQELEEPVFWDIASYQKLPVRLQEILDCIESNGNLIAKAVYRTRLKDGRMVAVKKIEGDNRYFMSEVKTLGHLRHRNVVKLLASCSNGKCHLLVYEYKAGGNLREYLEVEEFNWKSRLHIIYSVAQGLFYLHHGCEHPVVHRDVKCENIVLDEDLEPHLADFGLAMTVKKGEKSCTVSRVAGTFGYIAPEYVNLLKASTQGDVYSFGVLMLELLTNKHAMYHKDGFTFVEWVKSKPQELEELQKFGNTEPTVYRMLIELALGCTRESPGKRPTMQDVVNFLSNYCPAGRWNNDCT